MSNELIFRSRQVFHACFSCFSRAFPSFPAGDGTQNGPPLLTAAQYVASVYESYLNWLTTQGEDYALPDNIPRSELLQFPELHARRAPGGTCLSALESGRCGSFTEKLNHSKGCGGVMRVAPVAVCFARRNVAPHKVAYLAARVAAITHSHPLGYLPAAFLAELILLLLRGEELHSAADRAWRDLHLISDEEAELKLFTELLQKAALMAEDRAVSDDLGAVCELGGGWVAEETVAIALYCALRHPNSFADAVVAAVNHDGDSDSTGAVAGNIMGAMLGMQGIGEEFLQALELRDLLCELAIRLTK